MVHFDQKLIEHITSSYNLIKPQLNEKTKRLWAAAHAKSLGYGGDTLMAQITNIHHNTIAKGRKDLENKTFMEDTSRIRRPGGGKTPKIKLYPNLETDLCALIESNTRGDPEKKICGVVSA